MSTTAAVVEILITGIQASVWVVFITLGLFGYDWIHRVTSELEKWVGLVTIFVLAISYTLGIVMDRVADWTLQLITPQTKSVLLRVKWIRHKALQDDLRISLLSRYEEIVALLEYIRHRLRIVRATVLNLVLITITSSIFIFVRCGSLGYSRQRTLAVFAIGIGLLLTLVSFLVLEGLEIAYDATLAQAYRKLRKRESGGIP